MPVREEGWERTPLGRVLRLLGTGERLGVRSVVRPALRQFAPEAERRLQQEGLRDVYGTDVYQSLRPDAPRLERMLGGILLGGAVDPLTYVGLGELTQAGQQARRAGTQALTGVERARRGEQALVQARVPFTTKAVALTPKPANVAAAKAAETIQRGRVARELLGRVNLPKFGAFWDSWSNALAQKFGFNIGADPWLMHSHQELFAKITGAHKLRAEATLDVLEPFFEDTARRFSTRLNIPESEAYQKIKAATFESLDAHPTITGAMTSQGYRLAQGATRSPYEQARQAIIRNFGLPAAWGGPASPADTDLIRRVRAINVHRKRMNANILAQDEARLGHEMKLLTHPDAGYQYGLWSQETLDFFRRLKQRELKESAIGGIMRQRRGFTLPPSSHIAAEIGRTMRMVDGQELARMRAAGTLPAVTMGGRNVDPFTVLSKEVGQPASKLARRVVSRLIDGGMPLEDAGKLLPAIPNQMKNEWIWEHGWGVIPPKTIRNFFATDPTVIDAARGMSADRALLSDEWFNAVKQHGRQPAHVASGIEPIVVPSTDPYIPPGWIPVQGIPELQGFHMAPDEANFLKRFYEVDLRLGDSLKPFLHGITKANGAFRAWTLGIFPSYHSRNFVGAMWNYWLGSPNAQEYWGNIGRSADAWKAIRGGRDAARRWSLRGVVNPATGKDWTAAEVWRAVESRNGWGVGFISADDTQQMARMIERKKVHGLDDPERILLKQAREQFDTNWLSRQGRRLAGVKPAGYVGPPPPKIAQKIALGLLGENSWIENGFRVGSWVDDRVRMAHVLQGLREGLDIEAAITKMKKFQFDYHALTPFEKTWMKNLLPFYSWSRKNIPLQLESLIRRPDRAARFHGALQGWGGWEQDSQEAYLSEWMRKGFPLRVRTNSKTKRKEYFLFKNWLPIADIGDLFHMQDWFMQGLTPYAKVPIEAFANINLLTDRKIDNMNDRLRVLGVTTPIPGLAGEREKLFGVNLPTHVTHLAKSMRLLNTAHTWIDNPQELDLVSQVARTVVGRLYPLDLGRSRYEIQQDIDNLEMGLRRSARSAIFRHQPEEVTRLMRLSQKQREQYLRERGLLSPPKEEK